MANRGNEFVFVRLCTHNFLLRVFEIFVMGIYFFQQMGIHPVSG